MRRRLAAVAALAAALGVIAATPLPAVGAGAKPTLLPTKTEFPLRSYVLSLPQSTELNPAGVTVLENGQPVNNPQITVPGEESVTMLLIDASLTMRGTPIADAMRAARAFAAQRNPGQLLGVATFNKTITPLLPFTSDQSKINKALARTPATAYGTVVYDAVTSAVDQIKTTGATSGTIVLLADGQNVGSVNSLDKAIARLRSADVRLFSVGLRSRAYYGPPLRRLARTSHGTYAEAKSSQALESIYNALGARLANEYTLTYGSLAGPGQKVFVSVKVPGFPGAAVASYLSPGLPSAFVVHRSWWDRFIQSTVAASLVVGLAVLFCGLSVYFLLRRRDRRFERRLSRFVSLSAEERARIHSTDVVDEPDAPARKQLVQPSRWYRDFAEDVELGRLDLSPAQILVATGFGAVLVAATFATVVSSAWGALLGLVVPIIARWFVGFKLRRVRLEFAEQLPDNLDVISSALRAGHSLVGALTVTVEASSEPSHSELGRALADEQLGVPFDDALRVVARRMDNRDLIQVAMVAMLQREAGTNAAEVLERVAENVRAQMDLKRLVRTLTAQGRMARWIVSALPLFLFTALFLINRTYLSPLWNTNGGIAAMCLAGVMVVAGSLAIKKIVEIEV